MHQVTAHLERNFERKFYISLKLMVEKEEKAILPS